MGIASLRGQISGRVLGYVVGRRRSVARGICQLELPVYLNEYVYLNNTRNIKNISFYRYYMNT